MLYLSLIVTDLSFVSRAAERVAVNKWYLKVLDLVDGYVPSAMHRCLQLDDWLRDWLDFHKREQA